MSARLDEKVIGEIADELDMGMECFYHISTGTYESHPDMDLGEVDVEDWKDVLDKIQADSENYLSIDPMSTHREFQIMEDFARDQPDAEFKNMLMERLKWRKPFRNFKNAVDDSEYRQDWFTFKKKVYMDWVREQIQEELSARNHFQDKMNSGGAALTNRVSKPEPVAEEDMYRKRLLQAYRNLVDFKNDLFTDALNLAMVGELKEIDAAFDVGDTFTFNIEHLENSNDVNLQKLVEMVKQIDVLTGSLANINAIKEEELD